MHISIVTLFPEMFVGPFTESIVKRAIEKEIVTISYVNIRDFATDKHKSVDEHPYGGGAGMILRVDVVDKAITYAKTKHQSKRTKTILLDPQGTTYNQKIAKELTLWDHLIFVCGHYEGVDERIRTLVDEQLSIGNYVLTGGEIPTMAIVDSVIRLLPGTLKKIGVTDDESFSISLEQLEYPQYTIPREYNGMLVPDILLSGHHADIAKWKEKQSVKRSKKEKSNI